MTRDFGYRVGSGCLRKLVAHRRGRLRGGHGEAIEHGDAQGTGKAVGERSRTAAEWERRRQILDEFTRVTGYHRKHALRVLHHPFIPLAPRLRRRIYDESVRQALTLLWEAADRICGKPLKTLLPALIESMRAVRL